MMISRIGDGSSSAIPIAIVMIGGDPQPMRIIGPKMKWPCAGGNAALRPLMICGASRTGSAGNMIASSVLFLTPARRASTTTVRLMPRMPPAPVSTKP